MADSSAAGSWLALAERDARAFRKLADDDTLGAVAGFHAQQCVEKALKAILAHSGVIFRRTHDIAELLDLLDDRGLAPPPHSERLDELNPFAVEWRYGLIDPAVLDLPETERMLADVLDWVRTGLKKG